jgi:hypothetical protein
MSLINDALKKAQKQRTGEAPTLASMPGVGGESAQRIAKRAKPTGFNTLILRAGLASGVAIVIAVGGYFVLRTKSEDRGRKTEDSAAKSSANVGAPLAGAQSGAATPAQSPTTNSQQPADLAPPTFVLKTDPIVPKAEPQKSTPAPKATAAKDPQPSALSPQPSVSVPPKPAPKLEPKAIQYIESLKVAGIRASASDAKVLMNDRVYRIGSIVEAEMGLKLVEITANSLTFEDERGGRYTRTF